MVSSESMQSKKKTSVGEQSHEHFLLLSLSRAAQAIQRARTPEDFYLAVGREINTLGGEVALLLLTEDRQSLSIAYTSYSPTLIRKAEKLTGLSLHEYRLPIVKGGIYEHTLNGGKAIFLDSSFETLAEILPKAMQPFVSPLMSAFNLRQGVLVPLRMDNEALGLMKVLGSFLSEADLPAMDSFAGHIAAGLYNVRLVQKLQDELAAHQKTELALNHNRNLLLALSHASHAIQLVSEPDEIYKVVGEQIRALGFEATILKFGNDQKSLHFRYTTISTNSIRAAEKIAGIKADGFYWLISQDSVYARVLANGRAEYISNGKELFVEAIPEFLRPLAGSLSDLLCSQEGILAPLHVDDETFGVLLVFGNQHLSEEDLPAVESFSAQVSVSLRNAHLTQRLQKELHVRNQAEQALRISHDTFEGIFNNVTEAIYIQDENGVFLDVNLGAEKMYGYPRQYFVGRTPEFLSAPGRNDLLKISEYLQQAFSGQLVEFEFWGIKKDGTVFPKDVRISSGSYFGRKAAIAVSRDITERKKAEEELLASEAKNQALLNAIPDMVFVFNRQGDYIDYYAHVNDPLISSPADFLGKNIRDVFPLEQAEGFLSKAELVFQTHESQLFEYSLDLMDGTRDFEAHVGLYQNSNILGVVRDVTERKLAEQALQQAEQRFKKLVENAPDGIALSGIDGKIKYFSPVAKSMFDYDGEEYNLENPLDFIHPDDKHIVLTGLMDLIQSPTYIPTLQYRYKHKDGSYHWVESTFSNQLAEPGVEAVVINFKDITERKEMEKALYESEKYYRSLIENATDGIMVVNSEGKICYESPSVAHLLGYGSGNLFGANSFDLIHPDDLAEIFETFMHGLGNPGQIHRGEYRFKHQNGEWRDFEIVTHYLLEDPTIMGIIINGRDITKRKQAEQALKESERKFHDVIEKSTEGIALSDEQGHIIEFNDAFEYLSGYKRKEVLGRFLWDMALDLMPEQLNTEEYFKQMKRDIEGILQGNVPSSFQMSKEVVFQRTDRSAVHVQLRLFSMPTEIGVRLGCIANDITKIKDAEASLKAQNQNLHSLYQMTATLNKTSSIEDIYNVALDSLQDTLQADRVSILLFDADGVMRFKAWRGLSDEYRKATQGHSPWMQDTLDPQPILVPDVQQDASLKALSATIEKEGICALGFIPLIHQGRLLGKFMIYFNQEHTFKKDEVQLAQTIAHHVAFAINRKRTDAALQTSEERYRVLYEDNPSMYFTADETGLILSVNQYGKDHLGYALEELVGQSLFDVFHPDDREQVQQQITECLQNPNTMVRLEIRKQRKDGSLLWVREFARAVQDVDGRRVILLVCNDVTEEINARQALQNSESELRALFASMQDTVLVIDRNGYYRSIAPNNSQKLYVQPDDLIGKHLSTLFPEDKVAEFLNAIAKVLGTGETVHLQYEIVVNGQSPWFESSISAMGNDLTIWVARDITDRKKAELQLEENEKKYRLLAERISDVVWVMEMATMKFKYVSPSIENLLGYKAEEMIGKSMVDFVLPDSLAELLAQAPDRVQRFLAGDVTAARQIDQVEERHKDGSVVLVEISTTFVLNEKSELEAIGVSRDITRRKQAEDALRQTNLSLQTAHRELQQMFEHEQELARTDGLTQLYNRRYFFELAIREFASSKRYQRSLTVILFDIDGFKTANDTFGHALGDEILKQISQAARLQIREVDILARYGGDEFTILLPETNAEQAFVTAERIRKSVGDTHIKAGTASISVSLSLGVAEIILAQDRSFEDVIRRADKALYQAKQKGKNHTSIYSSN